VDSTEYELHQVWLSAGRIILENLASLDGLPPRCRIVVAPLKVAGANGAPARVLALVDY
jgi:kynurenine formamidase